MYRKQVVGLALKLLRIKSGYNQQDVSEAIEITQGTLSKVEVGLLDLNASQLFNILEVYKITPNKFKSYMDDLLSKCEKELTDEFIKITLQNQRAEFKKAKKQINSSSRVA